MTAVLLVIHLLFAIALVIAVLLQRSEGGALGMGGGGGGLMSSRGASNLLTRTTGILGACFFATSIALCILATAPRSSTSIFDRAQTQAPQGSTPVAPAVPAAPQTPAAPAAPLAK